MSDSEALFLLQWFVHARKRASGCRGWYAVNLGPFMIRIGFLGLLCYKIVVTSKFCYAIIYNYHKEHKIVVTSKY